MCVKKNPKETQYLKNSKKKGDQKSEELKKVWDLKKLLSNKSEE